MARAPGTNYVGQYYGGGIYLSSAATVTVVVEANTSGIDISLPVGSVLTGTITVDSAVPADAWVDLYSVTDSKWVMGSTIWGEITDQATGTWSVVVPAGTYKLWAGASNGGVELPNMYYDGTYDFDSATDVVATGTGIVADLNFAFSSLYGSVTGTVSYSGIQTGEVIEWTSPDPGNDWPKMSAGNGGPLGAYTLRSTAGTWYVKAFMDVNHNMIYDAGEPFGEYTGGAIVVTNGNTVSGVDIVLTEGTPVPAPAKIGVFTGGTWYLDANRSWDWNGTPADILGTFGMGQTGAVPVVGDWNGDGTTEIGVYVNGDWYLDMNNNGQWDGEGVDVHGVFGIGLSNPVPVTGDWNGDGITEIGIYSDGNWYLDKNRSWAWEGEPADTFGRFGIGLANPIPVTGDWNGNGITKIGIYSEGNWYLDTNASWQWDGTPTDTFGVFGLGLGTVVPVTGNW
jgi:hypothetical protein